MQQTDSMNEADNSKEAHDTKERGEMERSPWTIASFSCTAWVGHVGCGTCWNSGTARPWSPGRPAAAGVIRDS